VRQYEHAAQGEPRFTMLEMLREYAAERLEASGRRNTARKAHAGYFLALAEEAAPHLLREEQLAWLDRLEDEHDNLRAAMRWALDSGEVALGLRLAGMLGRFWWLRGHLSEGRGWLESLLAAAGTLEGTAVANARAGAIAQAARLADAQGDTKRAEALAEESRILCGELGDAQGVAFSLRVLGRVARCQGDYPRATALLEESVAKFRALGDSHGMASSLNEIGIVTAQQGNYQHAVRLFEESLAFRRALGDTLGIAVSLNNLASVAADQGDYGRTDALYEESLALRRQLGDKRGIADSLSNLAVMAAEQGDYTRAASRQEESLALRREVGDTSGIAISLHSLGWLANEQHNHGQAATLAKEGLALHWGLGDKRWIAACFELLAAVASSRGSMQETLLYAAELFGAATGLRSAIGVPVEPADRERYERHVLTVRTGLGDEMFQTAMAAGQRMSLEQSIACALAGPPPT
jgi:tetratricopeptide (TPR) repeat protein